MKYEDFQVFFRLLCLLFGTIGIVVSGLIVKKYLKYRAKKNREADIKRQLEESRRERRRKTRANDINDEQVCVVCRTNPIEVISILRNVNIKLIHIFTDNSLTLWSCVLM